MAEKKTRTRRSGEEQAEILPGAGHLLSHLMFTQTMRFQSRRVTPAPSWYNSVRMQEDTIPLHGARWGSTTPPNPVPTCGPQGDASELNNLAVQSSPRWIRKSTSVHSCAVVSTAANSRCCCLAKLLQSVSRLSRNSNDMYMTWLDFWSDYFILSTLVKKY